MTTDLYRQAARISLRAEQERLARLRTDYYAKPDPSRFLTMAYQGMRGVILYQCQRLREESRR